MDSEILFRAMLEPVRKAIIAGAIALGESSIPTNKQHAALFRALDAMIERFGETIWKAIG